MGLHFIFKILHVAPPQKSVDKRNWAHSQRWWVKVELMCSRVPRALTTDTPKLIPAFSFNSLTAQKTVLKHAFLKNVLMQVEVLALSHFVCLTWNARPHWQAWKILFPPSINVQWNHLNLNFFWHRLIKGPLESAMISRCSSRKWSPSPTSCSSGSPPLGRGKASGLGPAQDSSSSDNCVESLMSVQAHTAERSLPTARPCLTWSQGRTWSACSLGFT